MEHAERPIPPAVGHPELDVADLLSVEDAAAILDGVDVQPRRQVVPLAEALGRRLAEQVAADRDYPPFDKALMDGFAARVEEPAGEFEVLGEVPAGAAWEGSPLRGRQALAIMTGAPLPAGEGEVGVVPVEETQRLDERRVRLNVPAAPERYISRRGSDRRAGEVALREGARLGPQHVAVLASVGRSLVQTIAPPRCVVLATGDELVPVDAEPAAHQIRNSNSPALLALLERLGGEVVDGGHVPDDVSATRRVLGEWLDSSCDCLFITGGMSMGQRDYVPRVLKELGVELHITRLRIKPGKPFIFGTRTQDRGFVAGGSPEGAAARGKHTSYVFGLPGNPVSAYVCTLVLARRLLVRLSGAAEGEPAYVELPLAEALGPNGPRQFYQPARLRDGRAWPLRWRGSADVFTLAEADALIERPAGAASLAAGAAVRLIPLP